MNIIIGNQKGGPGKTTHCILFANWLVLVKKMETAILDMDFQGSVKGQWDADRSNYDNDPLYEVIDVELADSGPVLDRLKDLDAHVLIDLPGKMDDDNLVPVFKNADLIICPFAYEKLSFESTFTFASIVRHINKEVPIVFIPNKIKSNVKYDTKEQVNHVLKDFGMITPEVPDRVMFERIDTLTLTKELLELLQPVYEPIFNKYIKS